ncbi:MAG TPA: creatininase family protein [Planctomycetota bacterium]|nr:creatininase family protein [Planctomycetota bacterium]
MLLHEMKSPDVAALSKDTPVVVPIAALEQHGAHMPLFTDSLLCGEVVRRVAERLQDRVVFTPLLWLGNSHHHLDFAGTLSAEPRTYLDTLVGVFENLIHHGFKRLVFFNGHGGNITPGQQAVFELRQRHRERRDLLLLAATYWRLGSKPTKIDSGIHEDRMGHGCELETSMMLRLAPHLVGDYKKVKPVDFGESFEPADRGWITKERSAPGHVGDPRKASAEKGEALFKAFASDAVKFLERVLAWDGSSWNG